MKMKESVYGPNMPRKRRLKREKEQKLRAERMQAIEDKFGRQYASEQFVRKKILTVQKDILDIAKKKYDEELETIKKSIKNKTK